MTATPTQTTLSTHIEVELTDENGVIIGMRFYTDSGLIANAFGTPVRFQTLDQWQQYVATLSWAFQIRDAWRQLLCNDQAHHFWPDEFEKARQMLIDRDAKLEMQYKEK